MTGAAPPSAQRNAFGLTTDAEAEVARVFKADNRIIKLITVQEILDEQHVQKM